jgi:SNF2 family DNA or RNA helicase
MLRRRKPEVRSELPPVLIQDLELDLSSPQRQAYDEVWFDRTAILGERGTSDAGAALFALITRLKLLCNFEPVSEASSKLEALRAVIEGAGDDARILVFSQYVRTLNWIAPKLHVPSDFLIGSMDIEARQAAIARFSGSETPRVLLASLRAGGVGLNLGDATHVVLFDRWWNPAVEIQAVYRAHRFDRSAPLHVFKFLIRDSIEEQIAKILEYKEQLFDDVVENVETAGHHFTRDELLRILDIAPEDLPWDLKH